MTERRRVPIGADGMPVTRAEAEARAAEEQNEAESCDCPRLDAADWDGIESDWSDIAFAQTSMNAVLGVPLGYGSVRDELTKRAEKLGATVPEDPMLLIGEGRFRRQVMLEIENPPTGGKGIVRPGGFVFTRLMPAPWGQMAKVVEETVTEAREKHGRKPDNVWLWYLTCRVCSAERNYETLVVAHYAGEHEQR